MLNDRPNGESHHSQNTDAQRPLPEARERSITRTTYLWQWQGRTSRFSRGPAQMRDRRRGINGDTDRESRLATLAANFSRAPEVRSGGQEQPTLSEQRTAAVGCKLT